MLLKLTRRRLFRGDGIIGKRNREFRLGARSQTKRFGADIAWQEHRADGEQDGCGKTDESDHRKTLQKCGGTLIDARNSSVAEVNVILGEFLFPQQLRMSVHIRDSNVEVVAMTPFIVVARIRAALGSPRIAAPFD